MDLINKFKKQKKHPLFVQIDAELFQRIKDITTTHDITFRQLIEALLEAFLAELNDKAL